LRQVPDLKEESIAKRVERRSSKAFLAETHRWNATPRCRHLRQSGRWRTSVTSSAAASLPSALNAHELLEPAVTGRSAHEAEPGTPKPPTKARFRAPTDGSAGGQRCRDASSWSRGTSSGHTAYPISMGRSSNPCRPGGHRRSKKSNRIHPARETA
jgi:hypothetical protein